MGAILKEVADEAWKGKGEQALKSLDANKKCYRKGDNRTTAGGDVYEGYEGVNYVTAKNKRQPTLRKKNNDPDDPAGSSDNLFRLLCQQP